MQHIRYIISLSHSTVSQETAFIQFISENNYLYWHWLPNTWLLIAKDDLPIEMLSNILRSYFPESFFVVNSIPPGGRWQGYGPMDAANKKDMFKWLTEVWSGF